MYPSPLFRRRKTVPEEEIAAEIRPFEGWPDTGLTLEARLRGNVLDIAPKMVPWYGLLALGTLAVGPMFAALLIFSGPVWMIGATVVMVPVALVIIWQIWLAQYDQGKPYTTISFKEKQIFYPRLGKSFPFQRIRRTWVCWRLIAAPPSIDNESRYFYFLNADLLVDGKKVIATLAVADAPSLLRKVHLGLLQAIRRHGGSRKAPTA
jgi:hypothetical protein